MPFVKSLRDVRVATLSGHVIAIKANEACFVPALALDAAQSVGCVSCDEKGNIKIDGDLTVASLVDDDEIPFLTPEERDDPAKRRKVLTRAVLKCFKKNDRADFNNNGVPKAAVITRMVGFQVVGAEVGDIVGTLKSVDD